MNRSTEWIRYGEGGRYSGYAARRGERPLPAVIVIQEIWGVDTHMQDVAGRLADAGYAAFAPDLFAVDGERPPALRAERVEAAKAFLNTLPSASWRNAEERGRALEALPAERRAAVSETLDVLLGGLNPASYVAPLVAAAAFLRQEYPPTAGQGVASVGFCLGGSLSLQLAASDPQLNGAVVFYGAAPAEERLAAIACQVLGFYGELDKRITDGVPALAAAMKAAGKRFEPHVYAGAQHAFFNDTRPSYQSAASRAAYARLLGFLQEVL